MAKIETIIKQEKRLRFGSGKIYWVTTALVGGDECEGWGKHYKVGQEVEKFFDERYNRAKFREKGLTLRQSWDKLDI